MTWMAALVNTYDHNVESVGRFEQKRDGREYALVPISHTTQTAHIEMHLSLAGDYLGASVVTDRNKASTIIPCTEKSANVANAREPHPLFDKLVYVAGDYAQYCSPPKGTPHQQYLDQLGSWCRSPAAHPKVQSVYTYLSKGTVIGDLIRAKVLWLDEWGKLLEKWPGESNDKPEIFKVLIGPQESAFVRFTVDDPVTLEPENRLWRDPSVHEAFIRYCDTQLAGIDLCYVTGEMRPYVNMHGSRIRHSGDKAKLISANDTSGFTFRGRFRDRSEAVAVSYDASQKAHNALRWLIDRQGSVAVDGRVFVVWGTDEVDMPQPFWDSYDFAPENVSDPHDGTHQAFARQIRKALNGYRYQHDYHSRVIVMALDAATPGRMSIVYYRDLDRDPFLERLQNWHETCCWLHRYKANDHEKGFITFWGAPATRDIALAIYGQRASDKIIKGVMDRLLPSIVDGRPVPRDIVISAVRRASNPVGMDAWEWEKTLSITCALVNKTHEEEGFNLALDESIVDRDYLFGRLLAIADVLERSALEKSGEGNATRASNAIRYMNVFARYPARTWGIIQSNIQPYQAKSGSRVNYYNQLIDKVGTMLKVEDFTDQPLSGLYLLGFYSQRNDLYTKKPKQPDDDVQGSITREPIEGGEQL